METLQHIGLLDIIFIAILVISTLIGLIRGAIREILALVGLVIAIYLAFSFSDTVAKNYVATFFEAPKISYIISFILIIVVSLFGIALVNLFFSQLLRASGLSFVNRFLGMLFGVVRGVLIASIIALVLNFIPGLVNKNWYTDSAMAPVFRSIANQALAYLPREINDYLDSTKQKVSEVTDTVVGSALRPPAESTPLDKGQRVTPDTVKTPAAISLESATDTDSELILESIQEPK